MSRSSLSSEFKLTTLPLTSSAVKYHSARTNLTVQGWLGNVLPPKDGDAKSMMATFNLWKQACSQGVKCIFLGEPGKWVQSFFLSVFMLYRYCSP